MLILLFYVLKRWFLGSLWVDRPSLSVSFRSGQFLPGGSIDRPRVERRVTRRHTQTLQKPERADESRTQTNRNQTARPVGRSGYCSQKMSTTQGKFIILSIYLLDTCKIIVNCATFQISKFATSMCDLT